MARQPLGRRRDRRVHGRRPPPLTDTEEGRAVLFTCIGALALCVAGIARRLDWAVADHLVGAAYVILATVYCSQAWRLIRRR